MHFWRALTSHKDATAFVTLDEEQKLHELSFGEWSRQIHRVAVGLMEKGLEPGTRIGFVASNSTDWLTLCAASWIVGACVVPLIPGRERRETLRCLARSGAEWIVVTDAAALDHVRGQADQLPAHLRWVVIDARNLPTSEAVMSLDDLIQAGKYREHRGGDKLLGKRMFGLTEQDPTLVLFDPLERDDPHGAFFDGPRAVRMIEDLGGDLRFGDDERVAIILSYGWFHAFAFAWATLLAGRAVVSAPSLRDVLDHMPTLAASRMLTGPAFLQGQAKKWRSRVEQAPELLKQISGEAPGREDAGAFSFSGALSALGEKAALRALYDPIRAELGAQMGSIYAVGGRLPGEAYDIFEKIGVDVLGVHGYPECGVTHLERAGAAKRDSVGRPIQGVACKIDGAREDGSGQILVRADAMFCGYWDETGPRHVAEGWLHTGERGAVRDGFLFIEDAAESP